MPLIFDRARPILRGQNIRTPLGSFFNGEAYWMTLYPEVGRPDRSVLEIRMILQFQFGSGPGGDWNATEKATFAHGFVDSIHEKWAEKFRITTTSSVPLRAARDVGVVFELPYYIDGWHIDEHFELSVEKYASSAPMETSSCRYSLGNASLDSNDLRGENKGASTKQRASVHEFGHMLGLRDEYSSANDNPHHTGDLDSIMNVGEEARERHYAPFAAWLTEQFRVAAHLSGSSIEYKVEGRTTMNNALL